MVKNQDTELKILNAAKKVFTEKGKYGARMAEIADEAGINKALLHYYFRSKDQLFEAIFNEILNSFILPLVEIINNESKMEEKISQIVSHYLNRFQKDPFLPVFIINEMHQNPKRLDLDKGKASHIFDSKLIQHLASIEANHGKYAIQHRLINLISLIVFPVLAKPLLINGFEMTDEQYDEFLVERKELVPQIMINSLKNK